MENINNLRFSRTQYVPLVDSDGKFLITSDDYSLYGLAVVNSIVKNILTGIRGTVNLFANNGVQLIDADEKILLVRSYESMNADVNSVIRLYLGDYILWDKVKWLLNSDTEPTPNVRYGWIDDEMWNDENIWKD